MEVKENDFLEAEVIRVTRYGAVVRLQDGSPGFVHVSEIARAFVRDVADDLSAGDRILVKPLAPNRKAQTEFSFKQAGSVKLSGPVSLKPAAGERGSGLPLPSRRFFSGLPRKTPPQNFEDKLQRFMRTSEERQAELRRNLENKRGGRART